jgi:hypothetical protein
MPKNVGNGSVWYKLLWARVGLWFPVSPLVKCEWCGYEQCRVGMLKEPGYGWFCCEKHAENYIDQLRSW